MSFSSAIELVHDAKKAEAELSQAGPGRTVEARNAWYAPVKRLLDIAFVVVIAPAAALVVAVGAALIYATMGAPVFFHQQRVGRNGRIFEILKLRTMSNAPEAMRSSTATLANDPRITRLGRVLRASHIDELPQLWNILVGDMTLIGPRPEQPHLVARYREALPDYDLRHLVAPGLSGWSQVRFGYAADLNETRKKLQYDLDYLERFGPYIDLKIALLTCLVYLDPKYVR